MLLALSRTDITPDPDRVAGVGMLGWAIAGNVVRGISTRLHARCLLLHDPGSATPVLALVSLEICYITTLLRSTVLERLRALHPDVPVDDTALVLTTTHTHSAPGGYSTRRFDNASIPGFQPEVLDVYAAGAVQAIADAWHARQEGRLRAAAGRFAPELPVAFNRALRAHHRNPEVTRTYGPDERHLAIDREMTVLRAEDAAGRPLGLVAWFGVHNTCVHSDNTLISADAKGYASVLCEQTLGERGHDGFVALMCQGPSGDVTPNHRHWPGRKFPGGVSADDHESARENGRMQGEQALALLDAAEGTPALDGPLQVAIAWESMPGQPVDADLAGGRTDVHAATGAVGARMLRGTWEGPGTPLPIGVGLHLATRLWQTWTRLTPFLRHDAHRRFLDLHGAKAPLLAVGEGTVFGKGWSVHLIPPKVDPIVDHLAQQEHAVGTEPWLPQVLPLHLWRIGRLGVVAVPFEPTTIAGQRLRQTTAEALDVEVALLTGYCDDYSGYVTTPEEYERQGYEGAFTQFGQWTLPAWQTRVRRLAASMEERPTHGAPPPLPADLEARRHERRKWLG
ncbi:MAG: neutral/alkaline non-lysosomal ceramidase N-terminal domain-containing protein [Alphaproteobacteria bacterium]|nr:neutral/alkaline non-lysosomal ceramidase N-terminal domain-containing protein [Alphaproteobacteria bacterium]